MIIGHLIEVQQRCTFRFPPALASLRSLPSTAATGRAGTCPGSPGVPGFSQGWAGCARNQPSALSSRKLPAAGGFRFLFFYFCSFSRCSSARCAAQAAAIAGLSAAAATLADRAASNSPA